MKSIARVAVKKHAHGSRKVFTVIKRSLKSSCDYVEDDCRRRRLKLCISTGKLLHFSRFSIAFHLLDIKFYSFLWFAKGDESF